jgi:transcriptional regulator with XRE-family HTH domain
MPARNDPSQLGRRLAHRIRSETAEAILTARLDAGISQATAGSVAGMSHAQFGRIERAELRDLTFEQACRAAAAVGLRLSVRTYPDGDPARDGPQLALLERFRRRLPRECRWSTEVPLPMAGDRRAWDGVAELRGQRAGCEAETHPRDVGALERRLSLKLRDGGVDILILILADTVGNRRLLEAHREALRPLLPLDSRQVLASLRSDHLPSAGGIVVL